MHAVGAPWVAWRCDEADGPASFLVAVLLRQSGRWLLGPCALRITATRGRQRRRRSRMLPSATTLLPVIPLRVSLEKSYFR